MTSKKLPLKGMLFLFVSLIFLLIIIFYIQPSTKKPPPDDLIAVLRPYAVPLQAFTLINNKQIFTNEHLKEKWSFLFFGYTHCPDICPTTLNTLKQVYSSLKQHPQAASNIQVIFVSIDPERDKPEMLAEYAAYFNKEFIAITGLADKLANFTQQFSATYIKEATDNDGNYLMAHTSSIFLIDPKTRIVASFSPPHDAKTITSQYLQIHKMFR